MTPRWWQRGVRLAVAAVLLAVGAGLWWQAAGPAGSPARLAGACAWAGGAGALLLRRRHPLAVAAVEVAVAAATSLVLPEVHAAGVALVAVALYGVATVGHPARVIAAGAGACAVVCAATLAGAPTVAGLARLVPEAALLSAAVAIGLAVGSQRALLRTYRDRAEQAEREQRFTAAQAVAGERVRLARELHDVVAHHVSLLVVQAGAVRETLPGDHVTRPLLDSMIEGGRTAMGELRQMLGALRLDGAGAAPRAPQPTLDHVGELVAGAVAAGVPVTLQVRGEAAAVPAAAALSAYRVVQEALTNVVRHAPGAFSVVTVEHSPDRIEVAVRNGASPAGARPAGGAGHGIVGMRERAAQAGGTLRAGPVDGGWEVRAVLPLRPGADPAPAGRP